MVEDHLKGCLPCQAAVSTLKQRDPHHISPLLKRPWDELTVDFAGSFLIGDDFSLLLMITADFLKWKL